MNTHQKDSRSDRIAIMTADGEMTEEQAQQYCDSRPEVYGIRPSEYRQGVLI